MTGLRSVIFLLSLISIAHCQQEIDQSQQEIDQPENRWLSFYENMNGILSKLISPDRQQSNANSTQNVEELSALLSGTTQNPFDGYELPGNLTLDCASDQDCHIYDVTLSCVGADAFRNGRCMSPLKPSEHGCEYDDQCRKTCKESYCSTDDRFRNDKGENQCRCQKGTYFLWKKCWRTCLPGTRPMRQNDEWSCQEHDPHLARAYMHRFKRQANRRLVC